MITKNDKENNISNLVKHTAQYVFDNSSNVSINTQKLEEYTQSIISNSLKEIPSWKSCHFDHVKCNLETVVAYICVLDSLNFCFWPTTKLGFEFEYGDLVNCLNILLESQKEFFKADYLSHLTSNELQNILTKSLNKFPLLDERCRSLNEMGSFIVNKYKGSFENLIIDNNGDLNLIMKSILQNVSTFRDETIYKGKQIFMYKRIQILGADLYSAIKEMTKNVNITIKGVEHLTMFPDYRVPQILCELGILEYSDKLLNDILKLNEIPPNSEQEIEIRANTIIVVELMKKILTSNTLENEILSIHIDYLLWNEGEKMRKKIVPHHRTLTIFY